MWSNPDPANGSFAQIAATGHAQSGDSAAVVAAILRDRFQKQQAFQQTLEQVNKVVGDQRDHELKKQLIEAQIGQIQANTDATNSAPADYVPGDTPQTYTDDQNIHYVRGPHGWQAISQSATGQPTANAQAVQKRFEERQAVAAYNASLSQGNKDLAQKIQDLNMAGNLTAPNGPRITRETFNDPAQVHSDLGPGNEVVPEGYYAIGAPGAVLDKHNGNNTGFQTFVPKAQFDAAHKVLENYNAMLAKGAPLPAQDAPDQGAATHPDGTVVRQNGIVYKFINGIPVPQQ